MEEDSTRVCISTSCLSRPWSDLRINQNEVRINYPNGSRLPRSRISADEGRKCRNAMNLTAETTTLFLFKSLSPHHRQSNHPIRTRHVVNSQAQQVLPD